MSEITIPVGERVLGRVLNVSGDPIDGLGPISNAPRAPIDRLAPSSADIVISEQILETGIKVIDLIAQQFPAAPKRPKNGGGSAGVFALC